MAPNSNEWKRLVKVKPDEIIADDASREDQYENLGQDFLRVSSTKNEKEQIFVSSRLVASAQSERFRQRR